MYFKFDYIIWTNTLICKLKPTLTMDVVLFHVFISMPTLFGMTSHQFSVRDKVKTYVQLQYILVNRGHLNFFTAP